MSAESLFNINVLNKITTKSFNKGGNVVFNNNTFQMFMDVEFGVLSKDCRNYGICRIEEQGTIGLNDANNKFRKKKGGTSIITIDSNKGIEMAFPKSNLEAKTAQKYFDKKEFLVEEDFIYSSETNPSGRSLVFKIKKGKYPIIETLGFYIVKF